MPMVTNAPLIRAVLRTVPRRDTDDLARQFLGIQRPHTLKRDVLMQKLEAANTRELAEGLGDFVRNTLIAEANA